MSHYQKFKQRPGQVLLLASAVIVSVLVPVWYVWVMLSLKLDLGGRNPEVTLLANLPGYAQAAALCDGAINTPQGVWVVTRGDEYSMQQAFEAKPPALDFLTLAGEQNQSSLSSLLVRSRDDNTIIAKADGDGRIRFSGVVEDNLCPLFSHDGSTAWLRTMLTHELGTGDEKKRVLTTFRSDDQGKSWQIDEQGLSPLPDKYPSDYQVFFPSRHERWVLYRNEQTLPAEGDQAEPLLAYTADDGKSWQYPVTTAMLGMPEAQLARTKLPRDALTDITTLYLTPVDAQHVLLWQVVTLYDANDDSRNGLRSSYTQLLILSRKGQGWSVTPAQTKADWSFEPILVGSDGQIFGVRNFAGDAPDEIWQFDVTAGLWVKRGDAPNPFAPFPSSTSISSLRAGKGLLLAEVHARHSPPVFFTGGKEASISGRAHYYSTDAGRNWRRFDTRQYETLAGFDPASNRVLRYEEQAGGMRITAQQLD
ncbi:hypothetical protein [Chitinilyticum piscinae]|uniref:Uncharacterized protein n=1 Tax=Chitinilyticum piscinae TaxID=2866724 RepID=A0A8J7KAP3_9NEIS|nr:hypothetical protein [Chitinilyticum piscinae]MBE9609319.1 hypothetical protein [Chitinilyticum piscinae]